MIIVRETSPHDEEAISSIVEHSPDATIFHTPEWNNLVSDEFGVERKTLIAMEGERPVGVYTFFVKKEGRFKQIKSPLREADSIYGGPIAIENAEPIVKELILNAKEKCVEYYQIFTSPDYKIELLMELGYRCRKLFTSIRRLEGSEAELWSKIDSKRRNLVRKAQASGVKITDGGEAFIEIYYPMLEDVLKRGGMRPFPKSYYRKVLGLKGWVKPIVAFHNHKSIAGAIFLCFKDTVYYWSGAYLKDYGSLAPNDLIQWELMRWALTSGYKCYDLLIVEPDHLPGIAHFKLGFGGELVPIYEAIRRTPLGELARGVRVIANPKKLIPKLKSRGRPKCLPF